MGWGFRKSFGKGPFRVTVSKSGISSSVGGRGFRITAGNRGVRATASAMGFYVTSPLGGTSRRGGKGGTGPGRKGAIGSGNFSSLQTPRPTRYFEDEPIVESEVPRYSGGGAILTEASVVIFGQRFDLLDVTLGRDGSVSSRRRVIAFAGVVSLCSGLLSTFGFLLGSMLVGAGFTLLAVSAAGLAVHQSRRGPRVLTMPVHVPPSGTLMMYFATDEDRQEFRREFSRLRNERASMQMDVQKH